MLLKELQISEGVFGGGTDYVSWSVIADLQRMTTAEFTYQDRSPAESATVTIYRSPSGTYYPGTYSAVVTSERTFRLDEITSLAHKVEEVYVREDDLEKIANIIAKKLESVRGGSLQFFRRFGEITEDIFSDFSEQ